MCVSVRMVWSGNGCNKGTGMRSMGQAFLGVPLPHVAMICMRPEAPGPILPTTASYSSRACIKTCEGLVGDT